LDFLKIINETHYEVDEAQLECSEENKIGDECEKIAKMLTPFGICYTINMKDVEEIFSKFVSVENVLYSKRISEKFSWTPEKGYESENDKLPVRAQKGTRMSTFPMLSIPDSKNDCHQRVFTLIFHHPSDIPTIFHEFYPINFKTDYEFALTIKSTRADDYLRNFSPHHRKCYFENEKKLKFFKIYSKAHCELECNVNQTLRKCGCSYIAMPRDDSVRICYNEDLECVKEQKESDSLNEGESKFPCDCYSSCNDVKYSFKVVEREMDQDFVGSFK
jgi:amiloride-sensitive sodium channel